MRNPGVLMFAGTAFIILVGIAGLIFSMTAVRSAQAAEMRRFTDEYEPNGGDSRYIALFQKAKGLQENVAFLCVDQGCAISAAGMTIGLVLLFWALDRRHLIAKLTTRGDTSSAASAHETWRKASQRENQR